MNNWILGRRWNVLQAMPNNELLAAHSAREMGWGVFYPCYKEKRRPHRGKPQEVTLPYLPGYLFVADNRYLSLWELSKAKGVTSVLRVGGDYAFINDTDPVMRRLLRMADDRGYVAREEVKPITPYKEGDTVLLQNCPFALHEAIIGMQDEDREGTEVWITIFGGTRKIHLKHNQIGEVVKAA